MASRSRRRFKRPTEGTKRLEEYPDSAAAQTSAEAKAETKKDFDADMERFGRLAGRLGSLRRIESDTGREIADITEEMFIIGAKHGLPINKKLGVPGLNGITLRETRNLVVVSPELVDSAQKLLEIPEEQRKKTVIDIEEFENRARRGSNDRRATRRDREARSSLDSLINRGAIDEKIIRSVVVDTAIPIRSLKEDQHAGPKNEPHALVDEE